ncbi:MAG TPA: hypothetical protein VJ973_09025, partial [Christiangramia sp.]|nr:hypothetical protein [Christiangramia sp.]
EAMVKISRNKGVFLMEALWTMFLPHFQFVLEKVNSGELGKIKSLKADFGFPAEYDKTKRLFNKSLGGGSLLDIGIYPVFMAYSILGNPLKVNANAQFTETGVDATCDIKFEYSDGIEADLFSTFLDNTPTIAEIEMEKGRIILNTRFHEPTSVTIISENKEETLDFEVDTNGYYFEADHVTKMLLAGKVESDILNFEKTLDIMRLLDKIRNEIGLFYK